MAWMRGQAMADQHGPEEQPPTYSANAIHLVRTSQQLTMQLSQMADQKASILMGATFVVFTVAIGQAGRTEFAIALLVLALFAFVSALLAVMAVLPRAAPLPSGNNHNLLFFGEFSHMSEADFIATMKAQLQDEDALLSAMLRDVHQNGSLLAKRKYRYLALAYRLFIVGLSLTLLTFAIEVMLVRT
jgi:hypothetical protein